MGSNATQSLQNAQTAAQGLASQQGAQAAAGAAAGGVQAARTAGLNKGQAALAGGQQAGNAYSGAYSQGVNQGVNQYQAATGQMANVGSTQASLAQQAAQSQQAGASTQGSLASQGGALGLQAGAQSGQNAALGGQLGLTATGQQLTGATAGGQLGLTATGQQEQTAEVAATQAQQQNQATMAGIGQAAGALGSVLSDKNQKQDIKSSKGTLDQLMAKVKPVSFDYKASAGQPAAPAPHVGVVAQDLEQTPLKDVVKEDDQGRKVIDSSELSPALLNLIVELASQLKNKKDK